jgi:hypothetical protein
MAPLAAGNNGSHFCGVPSMFNNLEVKVLYPT